MLGLCQPAPSSPTYLKLLISCCYSFLHFMLKKKQTKKHMRHAPRGQKPSKTGENVR